MRNCLHCGDPFETVQSQVDRGNGKYCKRTCWMEARLAPQSGRVCTTCGVYKLATEFKENKKGRLHSHCRPCCRLREQARRERDAVRVKGIKRTQLLNSHGLTDAGYQLLLEKQGYVCAICRLQNPRHNGEHQHLLVDHDHATGRVRGLLCNPCNRGLGLLKDDPSRLASAIRYLASK